MAICNEEQNKVSKNQPLVSVIIPCFNSARYIEETIRSVVGQTYKNWSLLVIDDGSNDDSVSIVKRYAERDARIHIIMNGSNLGTAKTRNRGFDLCSGDYVALLDSDDVWLPQKLEKQVELAKRSGADIIYCSYRMIDEAGSQLWNDFIVPPATDFEHMLSSSVISCSTAMLSRRIVEKYHFPEEYFHEDYAYWMILLNKGVKARGEQEVLAEYRLRNHSRASNKLQVAKGRWEIYRKVLKLSFLKSIVVFFRYAVNGFHKYKLKKAEKT